MARFLTTTLATVLLALVVSIVSVQARHILGNGFSISAEEANARPDGPNDVYLAVKAKSGLSIDFSMNSGTEDHRENLMHLSGWGVTERTDGWYILKVPSEIDLTTMTRWCASVNAPKAYFDKFVCTDWGPQQLPEDRVYRLTLKL